MSFQDREGLWHLLEECHFGFQNTEHNLDKDCTSWFSKSITTESEAPNTINKLLGTVFYRDVMQCIQLLLGHLPFVEYIDYKLRKLYNTDRFRVYNEMSLCNWW